MAALTVASCWFNAILDGLERQGLERTQLTLGVRGIVGGRFPDTSRIELSPTRTIWGRARLLSGDPLIGVQLSIAAPQWASDDLLDAIGAAASDLGLRRVLGPDAATRAEAWRPWRAYGAIHVWLGAD